MNTPVALSGRPQALVNRILAVVPNAQVEVINTWTARITGEDGGAILAVAQAAGDANDLDYGAAAVEDGVLIYGGSLI